MKERPILFSGPMVRAILEGRKTQTRRVGKIQSADYTELGVEPIGHVTLGHEMVATYRAYPGRGTARHGICACPYGKPGDRLWVRETFFDVSLFRQAPIFAGVKVDWIYRADYDYRAEGMSVIGCHPWKPSIFMPRQASRINLEIVSVRVEWLGEISEEDAIAEGISKVPFYPDDGWPLCDGYMVGKDDGKTPLHHRARGAYEQLWESINGPGSWELNPWVWVVEFKRVGN